MLGVKRVHGRCASKRVSVSVWSCLLCAHLKKAALAAPTRYPRCPLEALLEKNNSKHYERLIFSKNFFIRRISTCIWRQPGTSDGTFPKSVGVIWHFHPGKRTAESERCLGEPSVYHILADQSDSVLRHIDPLCMANMAKISYHIISRFFYQENHDHDFLHWFFLLFWMFLISATRP